MVDSDERIILAISTHWIKYIWPAILYTLLIIASVFLFYLAGLSAHHNMWVSHSSFVMALIVLLVSHHWFFNRLLSEHMVDIVVTNKRVIYLRDCLLFCDDMHEIPMESIHAVEANVHGLMQNLFHYGSIWFDTGGSRSYDEEQSIPLVPHPHRVSQEVLKLLRDVT